MSNLPKNFGYRDFNTCYDCIYASFHGDETGRQYVECIKYDDFFVDRFMSHGCTDFEDSGSE